MSRSSLAWSSPQELIPLLDNLGYVIDKELATVLYLTLALEKPLLLEGPPGVGKTEIANILAALLNTELIRLQCYEGLDADQAIYEWNYQKQLLSIKLYEQSEMDLSLKEDQIFSEEYLLERPLLKAIRSDKQVVLLIDEIDRADEEFEAFLLEILSVFQISIPELGTIKAQIKPIVILTSNRTRELSDALKRRCLYHWLPYPDLDKERRIVQKHLPDIDRALMHQITEHIQKLRTLSLDKQPGIAETLDWAQALMTLGLKDMRDPSTHSTLGCVAKTQHDKELVGASLSTSDLES